MKKLQLLTGLFVLLTAGAAFAATSGTSETDLSTGIRSDWFDHVGLSYFTFFDGPGIDPGMRDYTPNVLGKPGDDGLRLKNYVSLKYTLTQNLAIDFQMRIEMLLDNANNVADYQSLRWQAPRLGISGKLLSGKDWALTGAANTDLPYFIPMGGGSNAEARTTILDPGLFAKFAYMPEGTRWSIFSLVMPRFYIYGNRSVAEPQLSRAGFSPLLKNEFVLSFNPSVNYSLTPKTGLRLGTAIEYDKLVLSSWNPFQGSLNDSSTTSKAWRLAPLPLQFGITHDFNPMVSVSTFIQTYPVAAQRVRNNGSQASLYQTSSIGMWISGTVI